MFARLQRLNKWAVHYHIYCIQYITKNFSAQIATGVNPKSFLEVVSSPNPNTRIGKDRLNPFTQVHHAWGVLVGQRFAAKD